LILTTSIEDKLEDFLEQASDEKWLIIPKLPNLEYPNKIIKIRLD